MSIISPLWDYYAIFGKCKTFHSQESYQGGIFMDYLKEYRQKLVSAKQAVELIQSGDWVDYG